MADLVISVRGLVEFLLRAGDLDNRIGKSSEETMLAGSRMHRKLQEAAEGDYRPEVPLSVIWDYGEAPVSSGDDVKFSPGLLGHADAAGDSPVHNNDAENNGNDGSASGKTIDVQNEQNSQNEGESLRVEVQGRADGIYYGTNPGDPEPVWTIDEIKTTYRRLQSIRKPEPVHLAQAKCYAYIYAMQHHLERVCVRMTYCNLISEGVRRFYEVDTAEELSLWFSDLMEEYHPWAAHMASWAKIRTASIHALPFPFDYRPGQKELAAAVYRTIVHERKLFLEAPTGTGKTLSVLFPSIKAVGQGKADRIFYLTAKTVTRQAAEDAIALMRGNGLRFKSVVLTAKEKICILDKPDCNPESCPRAKGHYDRINAALFALLTGTDSFSRRAVEEAALQFNVCPFELSLDISLFADAVIGDYNYLFDPRAYLRRFFGEGGAGKGSSIFLVDEAHNLVDRGRDMYSASLVREDVMAFRRKVKEIWPALAKKLNKCSSVMLRMKNRELPGAVTPQKAGRDRVQILDEIDALASAVNDVDMEISGILGEERIADQTGRSKKDPLKKKKKEVWNDLLDFYFEVEHFTQMHAGMDDHYVVYQELTREGHFMVKLFCVDPGRCLAQCMERGRSTILFSATLLPITYYKFLLGGTAEDYEVYAESVFDPEKRGLFLVQDLTSLYRSRTPETYLAIARCIYNTVAQRNGNYLVFFPSYKFLEEVRVRFAAMFMQSVRDTEALQSVRDMETGQNGLCAEYKDLNMKAEKKQSDGNAAFLPAAREELSCTEGNGMTLLCQHSGMREEEREDFLAAFNMVRNDQTLIGFCVTGGIFSEGIDLKNDTLIGVIVVGTGVPQVCSEREILKEYFDAHGVNGYDYAYRFPGMNKVQQAAGRVIRTQEDVGIVVLMDGRFATPPYRRLFPREWRNAVVTDSRGIAHEAEKFWNEWL